MSLPRVLTDDLPPVWHEQLAGVVELVPWQESNYGDSIDAVITYAHPIVNDALLDRLPNVKVVSNSGVGVDHIDVAACEARGIPVGNTPGCLDGATADMTFALLLASARKVVVGDRYARSPEFIHYDPSYMIGLEVHHTTLGIVGLGRIGKQVAKRARAFDMKILYHNRKRDEAAEKEYAAEYRPLDALLAESDFITLNCPLNAETRNLIGPKQLALMKPTGVLVNMSRGPVVDHQALYDALANHRIGGAALDVTDPEPLPRNHPLLKLDNLVIAPHLGSASDRTRRRMQDMTVENLLAGLAGQPLPYRVRPTR